MADTAAGEKNERAPRSLAFHKTGLRLLKLIHSIDHAIIPFRLVRVAARVGALYGNLALTARLIDALLARDLRASVVCVALICVVALAAACLEAVGERRSLVDRWTLLVGVHTKVREKAMRMDYALMEDAERVRSLFVRAERNMSYLGDLHTVLDRYQSMLEQVLSLGTCAGFVVALCLAAPSGAGLLVALSAPATSLALLVLAAALLVVGQMVASRISAHTLAVITSKQQDMENRLGYFINLICGDRAASKVMRLYDMTDLVLDEYDRCQRSMTKFYDDYEAGFRHGEMATVGVNGAFVVAAYVLVAVKVLAGAISLGAFTQYAGALAQLGGAWSSLVSNNNHLRERCLDMADILDFLDMDEGRGQGTIPPEKRDDGEYELAFDHVDFAYPGSDELVLHDVTVKLGTKHKIAVVGPNGAGKTTFIKLLCRLYEPTRGHITLNGIDIQKYDEDEYRDLLAPVFQDFRLFAFPVWENLACGWDRNDAKMWEALGQAGAAKFVRGLPQGLETRLYTDLGEGVTPSGGEAQKLALARALYKDAPVVILDEPTAALDPIAEAEVYAGFDRMVAGKTAIYISHRMSSCRFCDDILVFDRGRVVERGSHDELLRAGGLYAELWGAQAQHYVKKGSAASA